MKDALKRGMDCAGSLTGLLVLCPAMLVVAAAVLADLGPPVLFRQVRLGRSGAPFTMAKFRTMREAHDASGNLLPDEQRVTALGRLLRRLRIDETPELLMVLAGRMSLVGPRPLPPEVLAGTPRAAERATVRPGLTGLAQVTGNTMLSNHEKLAVDIYYTRTWTLGLDLRILLKTAVMITAGARRDEALIGRALASFADSGPSAAGAMSVRPAAPPQ